MRIRNTERNSTFAWQSFFVFIISIIFLGPACYHWLPGLQLWPPWRLSRKASIFFFSVSFSNLFFHFSVFNKIWKFHVLFKFFKYRLNSATLYKIYVLVLFTLDIPIVFMDKYDSQILCLLGIRRQSNQKCCIF